MLTQFDRIFNLSFYTNPTDRRVARNSAILTVLLLGLGMMLLIGIFNTSGQNVAIGLINGMIAIGAGSGTIWLVRTYQLSLASWLLTIVIIVGGVGTLFIPNVTLFQLGFSWALCLLFVIIIGDTNQVLLVGITAVVATVLGLVVLDIEHETGIPALIVAILTVLVAAGWVVSNDLHTIAEQTRAFAATRRLQLTETSSAVTSRIFARLELEKLLSETVEVIREQFEEIYHAQIFLIDGSGVNAVLRASTGEVGKQLIARQHHLPVGSQSVIGRVTQENVHVLASDASRDPIHKRNELLPDTRTELALPLRFEDRVIGALDLQSQRPNAFSQEDIEVFQTLANQIAIAIDNARLLDETKKTAQENLQLLQQEQSARKEIERLNQELIGQAWQSYLSMRHNIQQTVDLQTGEIKSQVSTSSLVEKAMRLGRILIDSTPDGQHIAVPITIQGITISVLEFELPHHQAIPSATLEALSAISERVAIVAENARLFESTQRLASHQEQLNQVVAKLQGVADIEELLKTAVSEFSHAIRAKSGYVRLVPRTEQPQPEDWVEI